MTKFRIITIIVSLALTLSGIMLISFDASATNSQNPLERLFGVTPAQSKIVAPPTKKFPTDSPTISPSPTATPEQVPEPTPTVELTAPEPQVEAVALPVPDPIAPAAPQPVAPAPAAPAPQPKPTPVAAPVPVPAAPPAQPVLKGQAWVDATMAKYGVYAPAGTRFVFGPMPASCAGADGCTEYSYYADMVPFDITITLNTVYVSDYLFFHELAHAKGIFDECAADNFSRSVVGPVVGHYC